MWQYGQYPQLSSTLDVAPQFPHFTSFDSLNSYVYRRYVCNIPTNSLNKTFALLGDNIEKDAVGSKILLSEIKPEGGKK